MFEKISETEKWVPWFSFNMAVNGVYLYDQHCFPLGTTGISDTIPFYTPLLLCSTSSLYFVSYRLQASVLCRRFVVTLRFYCV